MSEQGLNSDYLRKLITENYDAREHALVKHHVLKAYLKRLIMIVGQRFNVIQFVDCYSGPWKVTDEDLLYSSIGIAINTMEECRIELEKYRKNRPPICMRALFVEQDFEAFQKLKSYVERKSLDVGVEIAAWNKDFTSSVSDVVSWCGSEFTFYFVDPLGFKGVGPHTLEPLLKRPNSELLINFMYEFINRFSGKSDSVALSCMRAIKEDLYGDDIDIDGALSAAEREDLITNMYRVRLKEFSRVPSWTARMRILDPNRSRTKYSLIYLTHHAYGMREPPRVSRRLGGLSQAASGSCA